MALTPEDVANKRFTPTRFKTGYDEEQVDAFLDEVEAELRRLLIENADLRAALDAAQSGRPGVDPSAAADGSVDAAGSAAISMPEQSDAPEQGVGEEPEPAAEAELEAKPELEAEAEPEPAVESHPPAPESEPMPAQAAQAAAGQAPQEAALRLLTSAQRTAEEAIAQARSEASQLVDHAKSQAALIEQEASRQHAAAMVDFQRQRNALEAAIDALRSFEREYRSRMKAYLEGQLRDLNARSLAPSGPSLSPASVADPAASFGSGAGASEAVGEPRADAGPQSPTEPPRRPDPLPSAFASDIEAGTDLPTSPPAGGSDLSGLDVEE